MAGVLPRPSCRLGILAAGRSCFLWQLLGYPRRLAVVPRPLRRSVRNDGGNRTGVQYNKPQKSRRSRWPRFAKLPRPDDGAAVSTVAKLGYDECVGLEIWSVSAGRFAAVSAMWREVQKGGRSMAEKRVRANPSPRLLCGICFALCFFTFMLIEAYVNERCAVVLGSSSVNSVYTFGLVCTGAGFLSFSLLRKACKTERSRKAALIVVGALCLAAAAVLLIADQPAVFLASATAALLLTGHIGGCVYYDTAICFAGSRYTGRVVGAGMAAPIVLQFVVQNLISQSVVFMVGIFLSVALVMLFVIRVPRNWIPEKPVQSFSDDRKYRKTAIALVAAVVLMSLVAGMIDSVLTAFNAERSYNIYSGVRLFYALGLVLAGFIADVKERKYLPLATVCAILVSSVCMFFLSEEVGYFAGTALMYLYSGFYVIFLTVMFLDFAPKSKCPELWAGMGRIVRSLTVAATILPALSIYDAVGSTALAVGSCLISIGILLVLLPYIARAVTASEQIEEIPAQQEILSQERLQLYAERCSLTPRETEVLERLLTTDDDLQEIADSLFISRRMVQRHVSSIYEKAETKTRVGLLRNYMSFTVD